MTWATFDEWQGWSVVGLLGLILIAEIRILYILWKGKEK